MSFEMLAVEAALTKLLNNKHFSICDLNAIGKMVGVNPATHPNYVFLSGLHCVDYADMKPELRAQLQSKITECLTQRPFNPARMLQALTDEGNNMTFVEDRYIDAPPGNQYGAVRTIGRTK